MERGGFHGYQKTPNTSSATTGAGAGAGLKLSEINMRLAEMNQYTTAVGKTPNTNVVNNTNNLSSNTTPSSTITTSSDDNECTVREQDRFMPIANVIRIMRKILPPHAKISDDAKETIQECVSEYISFITGEANERCQREQRKTITAEDVLWAMSKLGFDDYIEPLTLYLHRYREMEGDRGMSMRSEALVKGATSSSSSRAIDHHQYYAQSMAAAFHGHGFFGYLKASDASTSNNHINVNSTAGVSSGSSTQLQQAAASAALPNGDHHQPHAQDHRV